MESSKTFERRKQKAIRWLKNPLNLALVGLILFTVIIRLYYFVLTNGQPLWWDEAEYLNMARKWAFGIDYPFHAVRQILFSLITAVFLRISNTEFLPRLFILVLSVASVFGVYLLGKELYNKQIGLISSFLMSVFYLNLFFTFRLLVDLPSLTFFIFSAFFFYRYFKNNSKRDLYWAMIIVGIGTLTRLTTAVILFAVLIYLLVTKNIGMFKKKELWTAALIFILILSPYIIWGFFEFGGFVITKAGELNAAENFWVDGFKILFTYVALFPVYLTIIPLIFFILGLLMLGRVFLGVDLLFKNKDKHLLRDFFLLLLFIVPLIAISFAIGHNENRYIMNSFPAMCIIASSAIFMVYQKIKKKTKIIAAIFLILVICVAGVGQLNSADTLIKSKQYSYLQVAEAGKWLNQNSQISEGIITSSVPQIRYYAERDAQGFPQTQEEFEQILAQDPNLKYFMISGFEQSPDWAYNYPQEQNLQPLKAYFSDPEKTNALLIIYGL